MNFLAHSALAFDDTSLLAGQFAGDFVRGRDLSAFPERIATGIRLHRRIDAFGDAHPALVAARRGFEPALRRHAGIVIDVLFDHLLARDWPHPGGRTLAAHARWVEAALAEHDAVLPATLSRFAAHLARERVLERNLGTDGAALTLVRLSRRSARMAPLALAAPEVDALAERLAAPFDALWPALQREAREMLAGRRADEADEADEADASGAHGSAKRRARRGPRSRK